MAAVLKKRALAEYTQTVQDNFLSQPIKKLRLVKKPPTGTGNSSLALISCLESCKTSSEALRTLLRVSDTFELEANDVPEAVKKLSDHFKNEAESAVRVKILSLLSDIGHLPNTDVVSIIDETILLLKNDHSHKVIAQGMSTILKLGTLVPDNVVALHQKLVDIAKSYLKDISHAVKCKCLEIIGVHTPICSGAEAEKLMLLISSYFNNDDARVRSQAFSTIITLSERNFKINPDIYIDVCEALKDDYEIVRQVVLKLVWLLGNTYPENEVVLPGSEHEIRLIDDAFGKVCNAVSDLSIHVRTLAAKLLGSMKLVSSKFLNQTLDKKLMSNMRRKVRSAAVESLCELSLHNPQFANMSLDFLVDMFNDEIEDVRLKAIDSLRRISEHIILRDDQLETILGALEDFSQDVREGLHRMLASCRMSTTAGLKMCIEKLLDNLKKYPHDKRSTYRCLQRIGAQHPELVLPLVPQLLNIHPFFDTAEPDVENPQSKWSPTIIPLLEPHTLRHYAYISDTMPSLVPVLSLPDSSCNTISRPHTVPESLEFLNNVITNLDMAENTFRVQTTLLQTAKEHLNRLSEIDSVVAGTAQFTSLYIGAQLIMSQILEKGFWVNPGTLATQQANNLKTNIKNLLDYCLKLQFFFVGLSPVEECAVKMFRLRALALNLVYIVKGSNASALAPCHHFLTVVEDMQRDLTVAGLEPDSFTSTVFRELSVLEEPKPGTVSRILIPILSEAKLGKIPRPNIKIQMSSAEIIEPNGQTDTSLKFTAGLVMSVHFEAELKHLLDPSRIRLKVKYPDQKTQVILPRPAHLKPLYIDGNNEESQTGHNLRLLTSVLISHQVWSEACNVEINIALAIPEADIGKRKTNVNSTPTLLDLCKPVKVSVAPKPIKRTL
ncbi:integrator complex subunit 4 [Asbolus verrucosus]|uniref:Integrator complex subunit 4 n=1 Tax=Asbolus verrucosus TaxID=1661398 RepID=A0A482VMP3_ASBVE|nr:integrator complex subunit 4 [Asbolus verrucosus]